MGLKVCGRGLQEPVTEGESDFGALLESYLVTSFTAWSTLRGLQLGRGVFEKTAKAGWY